MGKGRMRGRGEEVLCVLMWFCPCFREAPARVKGRSPASQRKSMEISLR